MNKLIIFALLALTAFAAPLEELRSLWSTWKDIHQKEYTIQEEANRFEIFYHNYARVLINNVENEDYKMALNKFADLTAEEFKTKIVGNGQRYKELAEKLKFEHDLKNDLEIEYNVLALPKKWDWREHGAVTPVKNQQQCGSCWAFSATGALEGWNFIQNKTLVSFSEQQLVDCVTADQGCNGGLPTDAFDYTAQKGVETEADYPYTAEDGKCKYKAKSSTKVNGGYKTVKLQDSDALKAAAVVQPVSVGIEADESAFQLYSSGVIKKGCGDQLDHGVLVVGYDTVKGAEGFIVKNSWGADWGVEGYLYISTNGKANSGNGVCGILSAPNVPTA